jgi:hypothetical protein
MKRITEDARDRLDVMAVAISEERDLKNILSRLEQMVMHIKRELER